MTFKEWINFAKDQETWNKLILEYFETCRSANKDLQENPNNTADNVHTGS